MTGLKPNEVLEPFGADFAVMPKIEAVNDGVYFPFGGFIFMLGVGVPKSEKPPNFGNMGGGGGTSIFIGGGGVKPWRGTVGGGVVGGCKPVLCIWFVICGCAILSGCVNLSTCVCL